VLAAEFAQELADYGRIYMYRFRPDYMIRARSIDDYPHRTRSAAAVMLMISNNLDIAVAQHPHELITYGGNGAVFQNWAQYRLTMKYLSEMTDDQTLVMYSGHPLGLFPSHRDAPRVVVTNGMVIPNYSSRITGRNLMPSGITVWSDDCWFLYVYRPSGHNSRDHITILNAGRMLQKSGDSEGARLFVSSGLGGMSGAQPKAASIAGIISVVAEVNQKAIRTRFQQGWVDEVYSDMKKLVGRVRQAMTSKEIVSIAYEGNIVDLWETFADEEIKIDLGSDQTSLHNPWAGGYYPAGYTFEESNRMMADDPEKFSQAVRQSLRRQVDAINRHTNRGTYFFDYGNAFLLEHQGPGQMS